MSIVKRVQELRLLKLRALIAEHFEGKAGHFADALSKQRPIIYRLFTESQSRKAIGDSLAREIESYFNQKPGWLDEPDVILHKPDEARAVARAPARKKDEANAVFSNEPKPRPMTAAYRKEVIALLEKMSAQQRDDVRASMRQMVYENVITMNMRKSDDNTMQATGVRIRSEGRRNPGKPLRSVKRQEHKK